MGTRFVVSTPEVDISRQRCRVGAAMFTALFAQHRRERLAIDVEITEAGKFVGDVT